MSLERNLIDSDCSVSRGCGAILQLLQPRTEDLGGFSVRRSLPTRQLRNIGPWIFFDHMGPAEFAAGEGVNVRPHPHINMATVTYLFEGEILHRDSIGSVQTITPGDLNLMVAGSGIVHSERETLAVRNRPHRTHGLQLWLALPEDKEEVAPAFYHYPSAQLPQVQVGQVSVRVMMGAAYGLQSPVLCYSPTLYVEARLPSGAALELPNAHERGLYLLSGRLLIGESEVRAHTMVCLRETPGVMIHALENAQVALIGGAPLGKRYIDWNFVSSSMPRIKAARESWRAQEFPRIPKDSEEFIPYPDSD